MLLVASCHQCSALEELPDDHRLVIFAINSLTTDMAMARHMPNMAKFFQLGGITAKMRSTYVTRSINDNWVGIFYGATSVEYGCDHNGCNKVPRLDQAARSLVYLLEESHNYDVQVFSEDVEEFNEMLEREEDVNLHACRLCSRDIFDRVYEYTQDESSNATGRSLIIVNLACLDYLGVAEGYGLENYEARVLCLDKELAILTKRLWQQSPNSTTFVFTSNHGGDGYSRMHFDLDTINTPFAVWGYGFKKHAPLLGKPMINSEIAPTIFTALTLADEIPRSWLTRPIADIYSQTEHARYHDTIAFSAEPIDEEQCFVRFTVKHHLVRNFYVGVRIVGSLLILMFSITFAH